MTAPDAAEHEVKDFTVRRQPHRFRIDDDEFTAPPLIGGFMLRKLAGLHAQLSDITAQLATDEGAMDRLMELMAEMFRALLPGPGGKLFAARLLSDGNPGDPEADPPVPPSPTPIGLMDQAMPVLNWLLECYGLRPTVPSSPSPDGSTDGAMAIPSAGTSSTAGASLAGSITIDSPLLTG
jgi:hypothetical protein